MPETDVWEPEEAPPEQEEAWPAYEAVLTFLPAQVSAAESPLSQYLPFRTMAPEEQSCAAYMFAQLTDRQAYWVIAYLQSWDVKKACQAVGLAKGAINIEAIRPLLAMLKRAEQAFLLKKSSITRQRFLQELQAIAFLDPADLVDENGVDLPLHKIPRHARVALQYSVKDTGKRWYDREDPDDEGTPIKEVRMNPYEKQAALKMFGQVMGYLEQDNPIPTSKPIEIIFVKSEPKPDDEPKEIVSNVDRAGHSESALSQEVIYPF